MVEEDLPAYVEMAAAFHANMPASGIIPFDPNGTAAFLSNLIDKDNFLTLLAEVDGVPVGIAGAAL
jgi:hypothetical protein